MPALNLLSASAGNAPQPLLLRFPGLLVGLLVFSPLLSWAQTDYPDEALAPAGNPAHEWLLYVALGLGGLNLLLLYLLNRSPRPAAEAGASSNHSGGGDSGVTSSRTDKRMDKRKREIDDLRQQVEDLTEKVIVEQSRRMTPAQIQDLVRVMVHDELTRAALPGGTSPAR